MTTVVQTTTQYPYATFRLVLITSPTGPTASLAHLTSIRITFSTRDPLYPTLHVDMTSSWSVWSLPKLSRAPVPSHMGSMRLDVKTELAEAWDIMWGEGVREVYERVLLYWPTLPPGPKDQQPFYRFEVARPGTGDVYVGAWSRDVERSLGGVRVGNGSAGGLVGGV